MVLIISMLIAMIIGVVTLATIITKILRANSIEVIGNKLENSEDSIADAVSYLKIANTIDNAKTTEVILRKK